MQEVYLQGEVMTQDERAQIENEARQRFIELISLRDSILKEVIKGTLMLTEFPVLRVDMFELPKELVDKYNSLLDLNILDREVLEMIDKEECD
jgi:hypothetical protein